MYNETRSEGVPVAKMQQGDLAQIKDSLSSQNSILNGHINNLENIASRFKPLPPIPCDADKAPEPFGILQHMQSETHRFLSNNERLGRIVTFLEGIVD